MALNTTAAVQEWRQLVEVSLTGKTLRYSRDPVIFSDGTLYENRLLSMSAMTLSAGQLLEPRVTMPRMSIELDNADNEISTLLDTYEWGNQTVTIKLGQGINTSDYATGFVGPVQVPGGVSFDDTSAILELDDKRQKDERVLPTGKFFSSTYANIEEKSRNLAIPLVYGDWRSTAAGGAKVPCFCVNTSTRQFKIAGHALKQIEAIYKNGSAATAASTDLTNGEFVMTDSYDPLTDVVTANVQGATHNGASSGTLLEELPDIVNDILTTHLGVASGDIDSTAFDAWQANIGSLKTRRHISVEISSSALITDALIEGFADIVIVGGKYTPKYRIEGLADLDTFRDFDMVSRSDGVKQFLVQKDPERITVNQIVAQYRYDPTSLNYAGRFDLDDDAAIAAVGTRRRRRMKFEWIYLDADAEVRAERELYTFSSEPEMATVGIGPRGMSKIPTDQFRLIYSKYTDASGFGVPFMVRDINIDFNNMRAKIRAWNILSLYAGRYTATTAPTWGSSTITQRKEHGFWTDANGFADPSGTPDATSKDSRWF